jgi:protein-tyrosine phosphatase
MGEIIEMIDLHTHILPKLDDGAKTFEESVQMCQVGYKDGTRVIVATPHILKGVYQNDRPTILAKVQELNTLIKKLGVGSSEFGAKNPQSRMESSDSKLRTDHSELSLVVVPGSDVHFSSDILQCYEREEIVTVNDQGRYLMIEFAFQGIPHQAEEVLFQLLARGIIPIITHPERNFEIAKRPARYYEMIRMGCLGQVTAMSLTGEFGTGVKRIAGKLLAHRLIHFIASDAHSINGRPPILSSGVREAEKIVGKEEARRMVTDYPKAVIEGRRPNIPEPLSF